MKTAALLAAPAIIPSSALGRGRLAPSDRVAIGLIGCSSRGFEVLRDFFAPFSCNVGKIGLKGPGNFDDQLARAVFKRQNC